MDHLAFMNKKYGLISKILSGQKTIESRWYVNRISPWGKISKGDTVYFKDSGLPVSAKAKVSEVISYENFNENDFKEIMEKYADDICIKDREYSDYYKSKRYVILIKLTNPEKIEPFNINKKGYGISCAWITVNDIKKLKI